MNSFKVSTLQKTKVIFDPTNKDHLTDYYNFRKNRSWGSGCVYILEYPFLDVPTMINDKIVAHTLQGLNSE